MICLALVAMRNTTMMMMMMMTTMMMMMRNCIVWTVSIQVSFAVILLFVTHDDNKQVFAACGMWRVVCGI